MSSEMQEKDWPDEMCNKCGNECEDKDKNKCVFLRILQDAISATKNRKSDMKPEKKKIVTIQELLLIAAKVNDSDFKELLFDVCNGLRAIHSYGSDFGRDKIELRDIPQWIDWIPDGRRELHHVPKVVPAVDLKEQ